MYIGLTMITNTHLIMITVTILEILSLQVMVNYLSITNKLLNLFLPILPLMCLNKSVLSCIF